MQRYVLVAGETSIGQFMYRREYDWSRMLRNALLSRHPLVPLFAKATTQQ